MRPLPVIAALCLLAAGCTAEQQRIARQTTDAVDDSTRSDSWHIYAQDNPNICNGFMESEIPCRDVLAVCIIDDNGTPSPKWIDLGYECTSDSPTAVDVCLTVPAEQWPFYDYTPEECAALTSG